MKKFFILGMGALLGVFSLHATSVKLVNSQNGKLTNSCLSTTKAGGVVKLVDCKSNDDNQELGLFGGHLFSKNNICLAATPKGDIVGAACNFKDKNQKWSYSEGFLILDANKDMALSEMDSGVMGLSSLAANRPPQMWAIGFPHIIEQQNTKPSIPYLGEYELTFPNGGATLTLTPYPKDNKAVTLEIIASMGAQSGDISAEGMTMQGSKLFVVQENCSFEVAFSAKGAKLSIYEGDCADAANGLPLEGNYIKVK
jgi:hypothetical protein